MANGVSSSKRRINLICACCGVEFSTPKSKPDRKYCSRACYDKSQTSLTSNGLRECTCCHEMLPADAVHFKRLSSTTVGLSSECRKCASDRDKELKLRRKERNKELLTAYRQNNLERVKQWKHESYLRNRESVITKSRRYRLENREKINGDRERTRAKDAARRARELNAEGCFSRQDIVKKIAEQKGKCYYCACDLTKYHVDHYVPLSKGGTNNPDNIVIACPYCNLAKGDKMPDVFIREYLPLSIEMRQGGQA